jgi:hypothetical protein
MSKPCVYRDAGTGEFLSESEAKSRDPKTWVLEEFDVTTHSDISPDFGEALKLEPGGLYVLELDMVLNVAQREVLQKLWLDPLTAKHGIHFVVLEKGMRIARVRERDEEKVHVQNT